MASKDGKKFEDQFKKSCLKDKVFHHKIKDVHIPFQYRTKVRVPHNEYDNFIFSEGILVPLELKSTEKKSISFAENIIRPHQIENLTIANNYDGVVAGFILNFRTVSNSTYFIHIDDFNTYKKIAEKQLDHNYNSKINKSSIPIDICNEIGIEIENSKIRTTYKYNVKKLISDIKERYGSD